MSWKCGVFCIFLLISFILTACQASPSAQATPIPPADTPFRDEQIEFPSSDIRLAGTLSLPEAAGSHPAVILISGSGRQTRDGEPLMHGLRVLADYLAHRGIAVLRYDDRGSGMSGGGSPNDTTETFAGDAFAAVQYLKTRPEIDPKKIGLIGHSEGGIIAPMVAARTTDVAFIVMLAGPVVPGAETLMDQMRIMIEDNTQSVENIEPAKQAWRKVFEAIANGQDLEAAKKDMEGVYRDIILALPEDEQAAWGDVDRYVRDSVESQVATFANDPAMRYIIRYNPAPTLQQVKVPVLALYGELDRQVLPESNSAAARSALEAGHNPDYTIRIIPQANHLFQSAVTGKTDEYSALKKEFTPGFLETIYNWISAHNRK